MSLFRYSDYGVDRKQRGIPKKTKLPTQVKTKPKLCLRCSKKKFIENKGCLNCGFKGADHRQVSREEVRRQLKK